MVADYHLLESDYPVLECALQSWDEMQKARTTLEKEGYTITGKSGRKSIHPVTTVLKESRQAFLRSWKLLSFPASGDIEKPHSPGRPVKQWGIYGKNEDEDSE